MNKKIIISILMVLMQPCRTIPTFRESLADYHPAHEKPFVIIITSFNNKEWYKKNLESVFNQRYTNYRVIYIDDHSSDCTSEYVKEYITAADQWDRFTLIENKEWASQMANHVTAISLCQDYEIAVHIDGDDWFADNGILELLNKIYSKVDIWLTYGQYRTWPQNEIGGSRAVPEDVIQTNGFREFGFYYSHPRTFYVWLFKKIKLKDLLYKGSFIPTAPSPDLMFMFPMIEMAGKHALFIPDILYRWNRINSVSQHNLPVKKDIPPVEKWEKYSPLACAEINRQGGCSCNALIWADDDHSVNQFLNQELPKIKGINRYLVVGKNTESEIVDFLSTSEYLLLITDTSKSLTELDATQIMHALETTSARAFFFGLDKTHFKPCNEPINYAPFPDARINYRYALLADGMLAWQMDYEEYIWDDPSLVSMVMIKQNAITPPLCTAVAKMDVQALRQSLYEVLHKEREVVLMHQHSKIERN